MNNFNAATRWHNACSKFDEQAEKIMKGYYYKLHNMVEHEECNLSRNRLNIFFKNGRSVELFLDLDGLKYEWDNSCPLEIEGEFSLPTVYEVIEALGLKRINNIACCC